MTKKQKKSPAFQFYPSDFLGSPKVRAMRLGDIGLYTLAMCLDWELGGFTESDLWELAESQRTTRDDFDTKWGRVRGNFRERSGRFFNARLDAERKKQREWRRKSSQGGKLSAARRAKGGSRVVQPPPQPKPNTPSLSPTPSPKQQKTTTSRAPSAAGSKDSWMLPASRVWEARFGAGSFRWAVFGKHCKGLKVHHAPPVIAEHLERYLAKTDTQYVSEARFAATFAEYAPIAASDLVDEYGCLTPLGEKETRPLKIA